MGEKKVAMMVLKVNLECCKCYKKVKKVLCKFPQIQDQVYDEKNNKVIIKVVCCNPEKIRDKLCCKGDGAIKSIEILQPEKPKPPPEKPKEPEKPKPPPEKPKEPEKPKPPPEKPKEPEKPKPPPEKPKEPEKPKPPEKPKEPEKPPKPSPPPPAPTPAPAPPPVVPAPAPVPCYPVFPAPCYPQFPYPVRGCCLDCYEGRGGGPCGRPVCESWGGGQMRYYDGYCGRPVYDSWGGGYGVYKSRCTDYICEENPNAACIIM